MRFSLLSIVMLFSGMSAFAGVPDSVYVRPQAAPGGGGLQMEWSADNHAWNRVTNGNILSSDYGAWGRYKKMFSPSLCMGHDGIYVLTFQVVANGGINQFGVTTTRDFLQWRPQDYPYMKGVKECLRPVISKTGSGYVVVFESEGKSYATHSTDLVTFSSPVLVGSSSKQDVRVPYQTIRNIIANKEFQNIRNQKHNEKASGDTQRFGADAKPIEVDLIVDCNQTKKISDKLMGIFFEDINYSADGGLYAELIENRDFEYTSQDHGDWNATTSWNLVGEGAKMSIQETNPIHSNNPHYVVLDISEPSKVELQNDGFGGIVIKKGEKYDVSLFMRQLNGDSGKTNVVLRDSKSQKILGQVSLPAASNNWKQYKAVIKATDSSSSAVCSIEPTKAGSLAMDFISLFPQNTFHGHKNGMRKDLSETLEALHPRFMRFPGGCVAHGNGIDNIYKWKETIGPLWERKPDFNLWGYHQSRGVGYYEYFQFCEDLQMEPLPVIAAGVPCQNSSKDGNGQQGGIPMEQMDAYIQDILDLVEWANGDPKTSEWAKKRAEAGHPKPFNLHYIGIGNEDLISPTFTERYLMIVKAIKAKYPEIQVCGTVGPFFEGSDYEEGWRIAAEHKIDMVDEHYYCSPGWYLHNKDYYDNYDRSQSKVYLGEYAAHGDGRRSTIETALACALHYCSLERNGDVVAMTSYAPLLAKEGNTQWNPDLIYFNNETVHPTVDYYGQMMNGQCAGDIYLSSTIEYKGRDKYEDVNARLATSTVRDSKTGKTYQKIVSMLPMPVKVNFSLRNVGITSQKVCKTITLSGNYDCRDAKPVESTVQMSEVCSIVVAPYSFTIIEL